MKKLRIGFIPLIDASVVIAAEECGFAAAEGLKLELMREVSWANIRDKLILDMFDAAHMLAPLAVATSLGLGHSKMSLAVPLAVNSGGNCITLAAPLYRQIEDLLGRPPGEPREAALALKQILARRREQGAGPMHFGVVFPFSIHAILLGHWLRLGGISLKDEVQFVVVPPPFMGQSLKDGHIEGYCVGEPWNSRAVESGVGCIAAFGAEIARRAPDKVLAMPASSAERDPESTARLIRACRNAARWCADAGNHGNLAKLLSEPKYLNVAPRTALRALSGEIAVTPTGVRHAPNFLNLGRDGVNRPDARHAGWLYAEMMHALGRPVAVADAALAATVYRPDLYDAATGDRPALLPQDSVGLVHGPAFSGDDLNAYLAAVERAFQDEATAHS